jgi:ABC-type glycerol-3-phosphate transport system substrate-binding protein
MDNSYFIERDALIDDGRVAMWISSGRSPAADGRRQLNAGVVSLPTGTNGINGSGYMSANGYFISAQTDASWMCWEWINFLTSQPAVVQALPARRSVAESEAYHQQVGAERAAAYLASVVGGERPSVFQRFSRDIWLSPTPLWLFQAYNKTLEGEVSVEEALNTAQKMADDYRACVIAHNAFSDQDRWQACLQETDPTSSSLLGLNEE